MDTYENVSVVKNANIYFDGKVTSRTVLFADGTKKTLGIMLPGEYEFGTNDREVMEILGGRLRVLLPGESDWKTFGEGQIFEVGANSTFRLIVDDVTDYSCAYVKE